VGSAPMRPPLPRHWQEELILKGSDCPVVERSGPEVLHRPLPHDPAARSCAAVSPDAEIVPALMERGERARVPRRRSTMLQLTMEDQDCEDGSYVPQWGEGDEFATVQNPPPYSGGFHKCFRGPPQTGWSSPSSPTRSCHDGSDRALHQDGASAGLRPQHALLGSVGREVLREDWLRRPLRCSQRGCRLRTVAPQ
jgi:hypothetical protein